MALSQIERDLELAGLRSDYVLRDRHAVSDFLTEHPFLVPLLDDARDRLASSFGWEAPVVLEVTTDPDEGDTALFARVQTALPTDAALARLDDFFDRWWLGALPAAHGLLHFDVE